MDLTTLALAKKYVKDTLEGNGALKGNDGKDGISPTISENANNTSDIYKLDITDKNGTITTPNLKSGSGTSGSETHIVQWSDIQGKPEVYPPDSHTHTITWTEKDTKTSLPEDTLPSAIRGIPYIESITWDELSNATISNNQGYFNLGTLIINIPERTEPQTLPDVNHCIILAKTVKCDDHGNVWADRQSGHISFGSTKIICDDFILDHMGMSLTDSEIQCKNLKMQNSGIFTMKNSTISARTITLDTGTEFNPTVSRITAEIFNLDSSAVEGTACNILIGTLNVGQNGTAKAIDGIGYIATMADARDTLNLGSGITRGNI